MKLAKRHYSVIFADDDPDNLLMLKGIGQTRGWEVETATSGEELLEKVDFRCHSSLNCFDIVVSDVSFFDESGQPMMSGIAAGRQLKRNFPNLPILFVTGFDGLLTRENIASINQDPRGYLSKPFHPQELIDRVEYLIQFTSNGYEGPERRGASVNRSANCRRTTDKALGVPRVLQIILKEHVM